MGFALFNLSNIRVIVLILLTATQTCFAQIVRPQTTTLRTSTYVDEDLFVESVLYAWKHFVLETQVSQEIISEHRIDPEEGLTMLSTSQDLTVNGYYLRWSRIDSADVR